ncbi:MAG: RNA polymerase sigma factor [Anaerolineae bacterium]
MLAKTWKKEHYVSDIDLIQGCRRGESAAWQQILVKYERLVYSIPLNLGLSVDDAADIAQLTFTILIQSLDGLRDDSRLGAWLATVARRHSWRLMQKQRREQPHPEDDLANMPELLGQTDNTDQVELLQWLNEGLNQLKERCRRLLQALYFDNDAPSYADIAHRFGMREGSIGPTRARCLARLRDIMGEFPH